MSPGWVDRPTSSRRRVGGFRIHVFEVGPGCWLWSISIDRETFRHGGGISRGKAKASAIRALRSLLTRAIRDLDGET